MPRSPLGAVAFAANVHFGLSQPCFSFLEYQRPNQRDARIDAVFPHRVTAGAGIATPNDASDLGIKVNETVLTALPEMEWYAPQLTNHSGGIALW